MGLYMNIDETYYINSHTISTYADASVQIEILYTAFDGKLPVRVTKSMTGHEFRISEAGGAEQ